MRNVWRALGGPVAAVMVTALVVTPSAWASSTTTTTVASTANNVTCAVRIVTNWPLARLANETIAVSVNAMNLGAMAPAARAGFGGLLLFGASGPPSMAAVLTRLQAETPQKFSMLVMTDEEGGGVQRLTNIIGSIPWAQTMGKNLAATQVSAIGLRIGNALSSAGVNVDLAPVLDVDGRAVYPDAVNPDGLRSFSGSPGVVASDGTAFMRGLARAGVTAVVKHFPGLGGSSRNTDYGPATTKPWSVLQTTALVPFERAIAAGVPAVMLSNASTPGLSPLPASLSAVMIQELRQTLGFQGLVVTDSLAAGAIGALHLGPPAAAVRALEAGADLMLYGAPSSAAASLSLAREMSRVIVTAVTKGTLMRQTLVDAAAKVLSTRNLLSCPAPPTTTTTVAATSTT